MYKNLSPKALAINVRQSEMIELTLTHGFGGFDLDIVDFQRQVESRGLEHAARFLKNAPVRISPFDLPVSWDADDEGFQQELDGQKPLFETAKTLGSTACRVTVLPASDTKPYHENFEFHRERLSRLAEALAVFDIRLGLEFLAPAHHRANHRFQFIASPDALITLMKTTVAENLGIVVDLWHWRVAGGTVEQIRDLTADQIIDVRFADIPEDVDIDLISESQRLVLGTTGVIDPVPFVALLSELGYKGPLTAYPSAEQLGGQKRDEVVRQASDSIKQILADAALKKDTDRMAPAEASSSAT